MGDRVSDTGKFRARPPAGIDPIGASSESASVYELIREDIIEGRLLANERLVVADLAELYGGSIALHSSPLGGLRAELRLPAA